MRKSKLIGIAVLMLVAGFIVAGCAATPSGLALAQPGTKLRQVQDRGRLIVGVKYDIPSFGLLNPQTNRVEGFDAAIGREIAAYIFGDPNKIEIKEALTKDREPKLIDGTFDVVVATFIINEERLKVIDFSVPYYLSGPRLLVNQDSPIKSIADVDGKKVGFATGSAYIPLVTKLTKATIVTSDNNILGMQELLKRNIDAFAAPDIILYGLALANPTLKVVGAQFSQEYLGAGVAKGKPEFLGVVNTVIKDLKSSGKWKTLWKTEVGDKFGMAAVPEPPGDNWK